MTGPVPTVRRMTELEKTELGCLLRRMSDDVGGLHFEYRCHLLFEERDRQRLLQLLAWAAERPCEGKSGRADWNDGQPCNPEDPNWLCIPCLARKWNEDA